MHDPHAKPHARRPANRLARSTSPYLLQHAHNPVDWWPWGEEAFAAARSRDVPIFLSIGYSTCYWCHVMERESFEDEATAALMNERFVCIKLDREERPDVDELFMAATVAMTGHGGWPMSVFVEPDTLRPFYCGTYYPRDHRTPVGSRLPRFSQVLRGMSDAYRDKRAEVREQAANLAEAVAEQLAVQQPPAALGRETIEECVTRLLRMHDGVHGGFGLSPKFPQPAFLEFLLDVRERADDATRAALDRAIRTTLDAIAMGGIHDHVGGGFHRYSVDARWTVPHFEKMLYDNAQLLSVYARGAVVYADAWYERVARGISEHVEREMVGRDGQCFSAQDAEVDGREGLNYLWTPRELRDVLPAADADFVADVFGVAGEPNFQDPHHPDAPPAWVLRLRERPEATAARLGMSLEVYTTRLANATQLMLAARSRRPQPRRDDKTLASWSGMMIAGWARAARLLRDPRMLVSAFEAMDFVLERMRSPTGLLRCHREGASHTPAVLEDYAGMLVAIAQVVRASRQLGVQGERAAELLHIAATLEKEARTHCEDPATGLLFDTRAGASDLFVRGCAMHDGAIPSGFATMLHAWLALAEVVDQLPSGATQTAQYRERCTRAMLARSGSIAASPAGCVESVRALLKLLTTDEGAAASLASVASVYQGSATREVVAAPEDAVQVLASVERLTIVQAEPVSTTLLVKIADGFHVAGAIQDGEVALVPFRVDVIGGTGVAVYAQYPEGLIGTDDAGGRVRHYRGEFELPIVLERTGDWSGTPMLCVRFQACSEAACFRPTTLELDIALDRG